MEIPKYVQKILNNLIDAGYESYIVGGCVRDLLIGKIPKDWDITTKAHPKEVLKIIPDSKYENNFGTVLFSVKNEDGSLKDVIEITTYRSEQGYSDRRHPDQIIFESKIEKDLERRDFTINAMAISLEIENKKIKLNNCKIIDLFGGQKDLKRKIIRAVGEPADRFREDSLRMMRAVRFSSQLGFTIEEKTKRAIKKMAGGLKFIANERIRDELIKILSSDHPYEGIKALYDLKLLQYIMPELIKGVGVKQNRHHIYTVFEHSLFSLKYCPSKDWRVRLAALLHDIGKIRTKRIIKGEVTFYNHELVSAQITKKITKRLHFSNKDIIKIKTLVRYHMFYYNVDEVTASSVRRLIKKVGAKNLKDIISVRIADRLGSGVPKAKPYKLRHLEYMFKRVQNDPVSVKMLKINGDDLIKFLNIKSGPKIGAILDTLLSEVIENPQLNNKDFLFKESEKLNQLELDKIRRKAKEIIKKRKKKDDEKMKKEFWVK